MARISVRRRRLYAGDAPWRGWGMNWGVGGHAPVLAYFDNPTRHRLDVLRAELRTARELGANSMRIYLELGQVMESRTQARPATLRALRRLLALAERERVYLDITGNLVWRPDRAPAWYDQLRQPSRWRVQQTFWRAVAAAAADSPAVLCYELTSEPMIGERPGYYNGDLDGWHFLQSIAVRRGRDARALARSWTELLAIAVRSEDDRPVTIGLLPDLYGAFAPANVSDLLDMLVVHEYPQQGRVTDSIATVRAFAAFDKPVLLGETALLFCDEPSHRRFLLGANRYVAGTFEFFDGRAPDQITEPTPADVVYQTGLRQFAELRGRLLEPRAPAKPRSRPKPRSHASLSQVATVFVPVSDQDRAVDFYVGTLGFEKRADFAYGGGARWVEVAPRDSPIALALVSSAEGTARPSAAVRCAIATDDIDATVTKLRGEGVAVEDVARAGTARPGLLSTDVTVHDPFPPQCCFHDPDGNRFLLVQPG